MLVVELILVPNDVELIIGGVVDIGTQRHNVEV